MGADQSYPKLGPNETRIILNDQYDEIPYKIPKDNNLQLINASMSKIQKLPRNLSHLIDLNLAGCDYENIPLPIIDSVLITFITFALSVPLGLTVSILSSPL